MQLCARGRAPCQENNVFRLLGGLSQAVLSVAPNTPRRGRRTGGEVMKSNRHFPFKVEEGCVWLQESLFV